MNRFSELHLLLSENFYSSTGHLDLASYFFVDFLQLQILGRFHLKEDKIIHNITNDDKIK